MADDGPDDWVTPGAPPSAPSPTAAPAATPAAASGPAPVATAAPSDGGADDWITPAAPSSGDDGPRPLTIHGTAKATPVDTPVPDQPQGPVDPLAGGWAPRSAREPDYTPDQMRDAQKQIYVGEADRNRAAMNPVASGFDTLGRGIARSVPFMDDIAALGDTAASYVGLNTAPVGTADQSGKTFGQRYQDNLDRERAVNQADDSQRPYTSMAGQIAGAAALPVGPLGAVEGFLPKIAAGSALGAGYGAAYGAGSGDGLQDRLDKAVSGAKSGAAIGAAAPVVLRGLSAASAPIRSIVQTARGFRNPEGVATDKVVNAIRRDAASGSPALTPEQFQGAQAGNQPVAVADLGGEATRTLARSAVNTSDEASTALKGTVNTRNLDQSQRFTGFLGNMFDGELNSTATNAHLQHEASLLNGQNYWAAYNHPRAGSMWSDDFQRLAQAPDVQTAIRGAETSARNRAVMTGEPPVPHPFMNDANGNLVPRVDPDGTTYTPSLQFWDHVQRNLRDSADTAARSGNNSASAVTGGLRRQLLQAMENPQTGVPAFGQARLGAYRAFAAEDALEAGQNFATGARAASDITDQQAALRRMSAPERELFARGYAAQLGQTARNAGDSRNIAGMFNSQAFRDKTAMALGPQRAAQMETYMRTERMMNLLSNAVNGNSSTMKQLMNAGVAGGLAGAAEGLHEGFDIKTAFFAALGAAAHHGYTHINTHVAQQVGEILASHDPDVAHHIISRISRDPRQMEGLRNIDSYFTSVLAQRTAPKQNPTNTEGSYASGGAVDHHAMMNRVWELTAGR